MSRILLIQTTLLTLIITAGTPPIPLLDLNAWDLIPPRESSRMEREKKITSCCGANGRHNIYYGVSTLILSWPVRPVSDAFTGRKVDNRNDRIYPKEKDILIE